MATGLYATGRDAFLTGDIDWVSDTIKVALIDSADYTEDLAVDDFLDDIAGGAIVSTGTLTGKTSSAGVADADDVTLTTVSGDVSEALVIYRDSGAAATSQLIAFIDNYSGLPVTPNGGNITISWPSDSNKIFKL